MTASHGDVKLRGRLSVVLLGVLALSVLLAGCGAYTWDELPRTPSNGELVGTWETVGPDDETASYTFAADGTWTSSGLPLIDDYDGEVDWTSPSDSSGLWEIRDESDEQAASVALIAESEEGREFSHLLGIDEKGTLRLFRPLGDPDAGVRLYWDKAD